MKKLHNHDSVQSRTNTDSRRCLFSLLLGMLINLQPAVFKKLHWLIGHIKISKGLDVTHRPWVWHMCFRQTTVREECWWGSHIKVIHTRSRHPELRVENCLKQSSEQVEARDHLNAAFKYEHPAENKKSIIGPLYRWSKCTPFSK